MVQQTPVEEKQRLDECRVCLRSLRSYLPKLEQSAGQAVMHPHEWQDTSECVFPIPVYESWLLEFLQEVCGSPLMNDNYPYVYSRNKIASHDRERALIAEATTENLDILKGILSRYALGGRVMAALWNEACEERIFYMVIQKMLELLCQEEYSQDA